MTFSRFKETDGTHDFTDFSNGQITTRKSK